MNNLFAYLTTNPLFWTCPHLGAFFLADFLCKKLKITFLNPLLIAIAIVIGVLLAFDIPGRDYNLGASQFSLPVGAGDEWPSLCRCTNSWMCLKELRRHHDRHRLRVLGLGGQRLCLLQAAGASSGDLLPLIPNPSPLPSRSACRRDWRHLGADGGAGGAHRPSWGGHRLRNGQAPPS